MKKRKAWIKHLSYMLLIVMIGFVLILAFSPIMGIRFDVVLSGSMSPALNTNDVVIVTKVTAAELTIGDIIVFKSPYGDGLVCHRIIDVNQGSETTFQTKGDNNEDPDPYLVPSSSVVGKVQTCVPSMGYVVQYFRGPFGLLLIIGFALATIFIPEGSVKSKKSAEISDAEAVVQGKV